MKKVFRLSLVVIFMCILVNFAISLEMMEKAEETEMQYTMMPMREMMGGMGRPAMRGMGRGHGMMCGHRGMMNMPMMKGMMACSGMKDMPVMEGMKMGHGMVCPMCGKMMGGMGLMSKMVDMVADKIELSEEQVNDIKSMFRSHEREMIRKKADLQLAMVDLDELLMADDTDMSAVEEKIMSMAEIKAEMAFSGIKTMVDAKSVLTEEQEMKLKKLIKEHEKSYMGAKAKKTGSEDKYKMYGK